MKKSIAYQVYRPKDEVKAALFVVHGMQEHKERYDAFGKYLSSRGIGVLVYDLPGHGETSPKKDRGWFGKKEGWKHLVDSAVEAAFLTVRQFPGVPLIFFGHSMGTMIGRCFLQSYDQLIDAMILSGAPNYNPGARVGKRIARTAAQNRGKRGHSRQLDFLATGSFNSAIENPRTKLDWLSYNEENVDRYIADEDCGFPFTCQGYYDLFDGMIQMHDQSLFHCTKPDLPILFFAGEEDPCIGGMEGMKDSIDSLKKAGYKNIEPRLYPHMRHETLQEKKARRVMRDTADWIEAHL